MSNRLAGRVALICLLAWTALATRPLLALESVLGLVEPPAPIEILPADQASAWTVIPTPSASRPQRWAEKRPHSSPAAPSSLRRLAAWRWTERLQPPSNPIPAALPPAPEQLPDIPESQAASKRKVAEMTVDIALSAGALPQNVAAQRATLSPDQGDRRLDGQWAMTEKRWAATNLRYQPLYFEEVNLERYGYTSCHLLQPLASAARFFATIPALPYQMALQRPCRPNFALGHDRPGSRAPWYWQRLPLQARAGLVEAGVVVGLVFLIP